MVRSMDCIIAPLSWLADAIHEIFGLGKMLERELGVAEIVKNLRVGAVEQLVSFSHVERDPFGVALLLEEKPQQARVCHLARTAVRIELACGLEKFFGIKGAKTIGFAKSGLAQSIYAELKEYRINRPMNPSKPPEVPAKSPARKS